MLDFGNYSFLWALAAGCLIAVIYGMRAVHGYRPASQDDRTDYDFKHSEGMLNSGASREEYIRAYKRAHAPRSLVYIALGLITITFLTGPAIRLLHFLLEKFWILTGRDIVFEPGFLVWKFLIFFGLIGIWASIVYVFARHFHRDAPLSLEHELARELARK